MTRYEAIDYLLDPIGKREKHDEAIHMAIEALKRDIFNTNIGDTIYRQRAIAEITEYGYSVYMSVEELKRRIEQLPSAPQEIIVDGYADGFADGYKQGQKDAQPAIEGEIKKLSSAQSEQTKMIKEIREWINSGNRGSADYFIVDKIEEIINKYE